MEYTREGNIYQVNNISVLVHVVSILLYDAQCLLIIKPCIITPLKHQKQRHFSLYNVISEDMASIQRFEETKNFYRC